ncbi:septum formation family protein [Streptomyces sp. CB03238]|uniref:septum formation family protein n=1 Tax=Streptomyces sp. CB03238 TaxID=1907777 RepID=UPI0015C487F6|nr:septum formation family protein [Streptomyces sp. CB03238]
MTFQAQGSQDYLPMGDPPPSRTGASRRMYVWVGGVLAAMVVAAVVCAVYATVANGEGKQSPPAASASKKPSPAYTGPPYGAAVGLDDELRSGDCLEATWPKFQGLPQLKPAHCEDDWVDGQVVSLLPGKSLDQARAHAEATCQKKHVKLTESLPDTRIYALVPSKEGWQATQRTACIIFTKSDHGIAGPVGQFRGVGDELFFGNMGVGDCIRLEEDKEGEDKGAVVPYLQDCSEEHENEVVGFVSLKGPDYDKAADASYDQCVDAYDVELARSGLEMGSYTSEGAFDSGFTWGVCVVSDPDGEQLPAGHVEEFEDAMPSGNAQSSNGREV